MRAAGALLLLVAYATAVPVTHAQAPAPASGTPVTPLLRIPFPQEDGSLTPYTFELGYPLVNLVYDTVLWRDQEGVPRPWLASSVDVAPDGRTVTLRLAQNIRWHDGVPLTSEDVAFTYQFVRARLHPRFSPQLRAIARVDTPDPATVLISLHHPSPGFLDQPLTDVPILPRHVWQRLPAGKLAPDGLPVGSGPYRLNAHRPGQAYLFEANPGYFLGPPAVARIEVPIIRDAEETFQALRRGDVDVIPVPLPEESAERLEGPGIRVVQGPSYVGTLLTFNVRRPPFDRPEVRRAVALALDLGRIARSVGNAVPASRGYVHPLSLWAPGEELHRTDEAAARASLGGLGLPPFEVLAASNDSVRVEAGRQVALALQRAGLATDVRSLPPEDLSSAVGESGGPPTFQAAILPSPSLASYDPDHLARLFSTEPGLANANHSGYRSAAFDDLVRRVVTTADAARRREVVGEALRLLAADAPVVPLFFPTGSFAYRPGSYDGWVFVKGAGIIDKRSFLDRQGMPSPPAAPAPAATRGGGGGPNYGLLALVLVGVAVLLIVVDAARRRRP